MIRKLHMPAWILSPQIYYQKTSNANSKITFLWKYQIFLVFLGNLFIRNYLSRSRKNILQLFFLGIAHTMLRARELRFTYMCVLFAGHNLCLLIDWYWDDFIVKWEVLSENQSEKNSPGVWKKIIFFFVDKPHVAFRFDGSRLWAFRAVRNENLTVAGDLLGGRGGKRNEILQ